MSVYPLQLFKRYFSYYMFASQSIYTAAVDEWKIDAEKITFNRHLGSILTICHFDSSLQRLLPFLRLSNTSVPHLNT